jgi:anti-sigma factor RsiW
MTSAEARERMDAALDGELSPAEQAEFERALAADASLREEYEGLSQLLAETRALGAGPGLKSAQSPDLLSGVQRRLRERSGGKFYRDRFAEGRGHKRGPANTTWMLVLAVIVLLAVTAWLAFNAGLIAPARVMP